MTKNSLFVSSLLFFPHLFFFSLSLSKREEMIIGGKKGLNVREKNVTERD